MNLWSYEGLRKLPDQFDECVTQTDYTVLTGVSRRTRWRVISYSREQINTA